MKLFAACPHCETVFSIVQEQLQSSNGWVRCGHCMEIFNANERLLDVSPPASSAVLKPAPAPVEEPSFDVASPLESSLVDPIDITQTIPEREMDALPAEAMPKKASVFSIFIRRMALFFVALLLLGVLIWQLIYYGHHRLQQLAPVAVQKWCDTFVCSSSVHQQINGWLIENSSFQKLNEQSFQLEMTLKNISTSILMMPHLELTLLDMSDAVLVRQVIPPDAKQPINFLPRAEHQYRWMVTLQATSRPRLSASDIAGYHVTLFYP